MGLKRCFSKKKKGSLNLSINAIVVLILAITMLGLGLGFINKLFGGATKNIGDQITAINDQDLKRLENEGITQLSKGNIELGKKESKQLILAIKNDESSARDFTVTVDCYDDEGRLCSDTGGANNKIVLRSATGVNTEGGLPAVATLTGSRQLPGETLKTFSVVIESKPGIKAGVYTFDVKVEAGGAGTCAAPTGCGVGVLCQCAAGCSPTGTTCTTNPSSTTDCSCVPDVSADDVTLLPLVVSIG